MVDFARLKTQVTILQVIQMLGLVMKKSGAQVRSQCPACKKGDRSLAVTVEKGAFYCFDEKKGGDIIALVAHVLGMDQKAAAEHIASHFGLDTSRTTPAPTTTAARGMPALEDLDPLHEAVEALGITPSAADALGIGHRGRGTLGAGVYIPLRTEEGALVGYMRVNLEEAEPFRFPTNLEDRATGNVVKLERRKA